MPEDEGDSVSLRQSVTERGKKEEAKRWTEARSWQTEEEGRNVQVRLHCCPLWGVEGQGTMATRVGKEAGLEDRGILGYCFTYQSPGAGRKIPE